MTLELWFLFGVIAVVAAWSLATKLVQRLRASQLKRQRQGQSLESFLRYFVVDDIPETLAAEVYRYFQKLQQVRNFPVSPEDDIEKVYGLRDENLLDAIAEIAQNCRYPVPPDNDPIWGQALIVTIEDLVRFVDLLRPQNSGYLS
ncbi:MAG: hypothetical protein MUF49_20420 [Oculatellaceae cyanobacterium Prado106]|jgi:hypothetical protein|nr:hypothetical protein [Oculatellaceae cyanobacterium Prado106]